MNRFLKVQKIRQCLRRNDFSIGSWMQIPHPSVAEIMGSAGYDWVALDLEHGTFGLHQLPDLFRALELGDTLPLVRLAHGEPTACKQALDAGAGGVIIPMIESVTHLERVRDACCWPPTGTRGVGFSRANLFGKHFDAYISEAQAPLLIAMIEHVNAIEQLPDILTVEGLDAILVGPYDLSASMGLTAQFNHPEVKSALAQIYELTCRTSIACGVHVVEPSPAQLQQRIEEGYRFLAYSIDAVFMHTSAQNPLKKDDEV